MVSKLDNALFFQQQALNLRAQRQQILAANIANADTPNFKARDFDFSTALKNAIGANGGAALTMAATDAGHLQPSGGKGAAPLLYRKETQSSVDGNTVNMDVERAQFAENAVHYEAGLAFLTHQIKTLMTAIQSQG